MTAKSGYVVEPNNIYCRSSSQARNGLCQKLADYAKCDNCPLPTAVVTPSGMSAIYVMLQSILNIADAKLHRAEPHLVFGDEMYDDLEDTLFYLQVTHHFSYEMVDIRDHQALTTIFKKHSNNIHLLFIE